MLSPAMDMAAMEVMADPMVDMAATMARGRLRPLLMLSPAMDMADLMDTALMAVPMVDMADMADLMEAMVDMDMADLMVDMVDTEATAMESKPHLKEPSNQLSCCN